MRRSQRRGKKISGGGSLPACSRTTVMGMGTNSQWMEGFIISILSWAQARTVQLLATMKKKPVDQPHIRMPVSASTPATRRQPFASMSGRPLFPRYAGPFEIAAKRQVQVHAFAQAGGADLGQLDFCGEIFPGKPQDREHVDLALFELLPAEFHGVGTARNRVSQRAFAFAQVVIACESVFHVFERSHRGAHVACRGGFLVGGAKILRSLKFTAEENRLSDPGSQTPDDGIERADRVELRGSESTRAAKHKARQARGASLVHPMKGCCETALTGDEVRPAFENLRGQTGRHAFWLSGEGRSHVSSASGIGA